MTEDEARQTRIDKLVAEMEATIAEAQATSARMTRLFDEMGIDDAAVLRAAVDSGRCSSALRAMVDEDMAQLDRQLKESESTLLLQTAHRDTPKPHRRKRRMTRI